MTAENRAEKLEVYAKAHPMLVEALKLFPREMWHFKAAPNEWSIHETVIHITDSEANSYARCRRCIAEPGSDVMAYDENLWMRELRYSDQSAEDALELFKPLRMNTYKLIKDLPEATWANTIYHPQNGAMTLDDWLDVYARHIPEHIEQMERCYQSWSDSE